MIHQLQQAASEPEFFLLYEGGEVTDELRRPLTRVRVGPQVTEIPNNAFRGCDKLVELQLNEGLKAIGKYAFGGCTALRGVTIPSSVTALGWEAFSHCSLAEVQLREGLQIVGPCAFYKCTSLRSVTLPSSVTEINLSAFRFCRSLTELNLNEGLQDIDESAFESCTALRSVTIPSTVTLLDGMAFGGCSGLSEVQLNEGLQFIGTGAFYGCTALRSVTIPSTVTDLSGVFYGCSNLSEVIFLGGNRLLNQEFVDCGFRRDEHGLLNQEVIKEMFFGENSNYAFQGCSLTTLKFSISWAVSERMAQLPRECMLSVEKRIHNMHHLELQHDGNILACFPVVYVSRYDDDEFEDGAYEVRDTNHETARSLYRVLQSIAYHELKESSIVVELALWKSTIDVGGDRACRVALPGPAKSLMMEYCGFAGFLRPVF